MSAAFRLVVLLLFLLGVQVSGQNLAFKIRNFEYQNEPLKVKILHQDKNGIFWLGTSKGLFRYDGHLTEPVQVSGTKKLKPITSIGETNAGIIWIGCENGEIFHFKDQHLIAFQPAEGLPKKAVSAILEDKNGLIWFATYGEGLYFWKQNRLYNLNTDDGLPDDYVYALTPDFKSNIWAATDRGIGICQFKNNRKEVRKISTSQGLPDNLVTSLISSSDQKQIWLGTYSGGFASVNAQTLKIEIPEIAENWKYGPVSNLLPTENGCFIGADGQHLLEFRNRPGQLFQHFKLPSTENRFKISDLQRDKEGFIWVAGNSSEVLTANPMFRFLETGNDQSLHAVLPDHAGNIWFSTDNGIFCAQKSTAGYHIVPKFQNLNLKGRSVISLFEDEGGFLWLGTFGKGLYRVEPETGKARLLTEKEGLPNENVLSISGKGNEIWLATLGGAARCKISGELNKLDAPLKFEAFNQQRGLGINYIYQVLLDSKNRVWFATDGKGITMLQNGRFQTFSEKEGLPGKTVYSLAETSDGTIWASLPKNGLFKFTGRKFEAFGKGQKLQAQTLSGITGTPNGNLLIVHPKGVEMLDPKTGNVAYWGEEAGLKFAEPDLNALGQTKNEAIWFGVPGKLIAFEPAQTKFQAFPEIELARVELFLKPINVASGYKFAHDENYLTFNYAGLWYQNPEAVTYRLKLEGYDQEWIYSSNRSITYPQLPPGRYVFRISASANGKFENAAVKEFAFAIKKPFWTTWWFYLLSFLLLAGIVYAYMKARENRLKSAERLEKDKVMFQFETLKNQVNPHFLFNSFNTLVAIIEDDQKAAVEYVERMSDFFRDILLYREKDTISIREELNLIRNYYFLQQKRYGCNLRLEINIPETELDKQIAPLTLQLLVENAIKHNVVSRDKPLQVEIFIDSEENFTVRNNLQKKKNPEISTGIGLNNIRNRYAILTKRPVFVQENDTFFEVKVPVLN